MVGWQINDGKPWRRVALINDDNGVVVFLGVGNRNPFIIIPPTPATHILLAFLENPAAFRTSFIQIFDNTASLPCCRDRFGEQACQSLRKTHPALFEKRCLSDHDFHSIDCCSECRRYIVKNKISAENARVLFKAPSLCRDKHSVSFCRRFKATGMGKYSCADAEFAVRVCRHSCGYCNDELYAAQNAPRLCSADIGNETDIAFKLLRTPN
ncbi:unnamed protein product [Caenorhabditis auriculariae]|uniref:Uncharacterized protein n=1 Tax=Caenorhabditis auriculariae TaxID=2777116 RepID=A0A8S1GTW8_9PELO|nr:unnamed protein product [Caenorhabditis auriculariae]